MRVMWHASSRLVPRLREVCEVRRTRPNVTPMILQHISRGGQASVSKFTNNATLFTIHYKFWTAFIQHLQTHASGSHGVYMIQGFHNGSFGDFILIEAFDSRGMER